MPSSTNMIYIFFLSSRPFSAGCPGLIPGFRKKNSALFPAGCPGLIQEFFEKKKKRVLGFKFLSFLGDGFGVKAKKKAGTSGLCLTVTGTH